MKKKLIGIILVLTLVAIVFSGCSGDNEISNGSINDLKFILEANKTTYTNSSENIVVKITLTNTKESSVYVEKRFYFGSTINYEIHGISNKYFEEYNGPMDDYLPEKNILKPDEKLEHEFILMNKVRFEEMYKELGTEVYGNYSLEMTYGSSFTTEIIKSNIIEFEIH